jgi:phage/plasmid-associated DNA primase
MEYTDNLFWKTQTPFLLADEAIIINRLEQNEPTFEVTGSNDNICRMYFDIDYHLKPNEFNTQVNQHIRETGKKYITKCISEVLQIEPKITVATSSFEHKYSWRYWCPNIKMKKNEMQDFVVTMNKYIESIDDIFDYIEKPKTGGLFDEGIYDKNRKMRCINTSKPNENRPLILVEGNIADTLITGFTDNATLATYAIAPKIIIPSSPTSVTSTSVLNDNAHSELLKIIGNKGHKREKWLTLCSWFVSNSSKANFLDFVDAEWRDQAEKMFDDFTSNQRQCSIYALDNIAKEVNYDAYKQWRSKHNKYITFEVLDKGSNDVAKFVANRLKQNMIYCNETWYQFDAQSYLWRMVKKPDATIITHIQKEIDEARENILYRKNRTDDEAEIETLTKLEKRFIGFYKEVAGGGYVSQIIKFLTTYLFDGDFIKLLDNHTYKIAFKNGMLDLKTLEFRCGLFQSDFLTKTIPYNYVQKKDTDEDVQQVKKALKKICNWNDAHLDYYLSSIGYAMTGDSNKEQMFWYFRGQTAQNGKSVVIEALEKIMPNYVIKGTNTFLDKAVELKKEVPTWKGKRIVWLNELSTKMKDEDIVKSICDGTDFKYNRNYATEAEKVAIGFKLFVVSNNSLNIKGDEGVKRRFRLCQFNAQFQENTTEDCFKTLQFKRNKCFGDDLCGSHRDALLHLIFSYSKLYATEKKLKPYPVEWNEDAEENMADNNKFESWFKDNFELGSEFECGRQELDNYMPVEFKNLKIKDELTKMKIPFKYNSQERKKGYKERGLYLGFKYKETEVVKV